MPLVEDLSTEQMAFQLVGDEPGRFQVLRYRGTEGLCRLFRFELELASVDTSVELGDVVGRAAKFNVAVAGGHRWFHGIIGHFELTGETHDQAYYRLELVPQVWLLTHRYNSRIFQNKSTKDIIMDVLTKSGIPADRFDLAGVSRTTPREYCVQYREHDYNFICRLMEEEGIRWWFEHTEDGHVLMLSDDTSQYPAIEGSSELCYRPPSGMNFDEEHVFRFRLGQSVRPGSVVLDDFTFENPKLNLQAKSDRARDLGLEFYDCPGEYAAQAAGGEVAKMRAEEFETSRIRGVGQSNCGRLSPGKTFTLTEHTATNANGSYLVTSVTHQGKQAIGRTTSTNGWSSLLDARLHQALLQARRSNEPAVRDLAEALLAVAGRIRAGDPTARRSLTDWVYHAGQVSRDISASASAAGGGPLELLGLTHLLNEAATLDLLDLDAPTYECRFECIPATAPYRPPRITPWPVMRGSQTARVVGPAGEEIHTDQYGRVKVQFHWDREGSEAGSPKKFGADSSCWIRVSQGMAGGQYGMMFLPRVGQEVVVDFLEGDPDKPLIVGRVFNADNMPPYTLPDEKTRSTIKTHSTKGGGGTNEIRFEDLKDSEQILVQAQKDLHIRVLNQERHNVKENRFLTVEGEQRTKIVKNRSHDVGGKDALHVTETRSVKVDQDVYEEFGANHDHKVSAEYHLKANKVVVETDTGVSFKVGGNFLAITPAGVFIKGTMVHINGAGAALPSSVVAQLASPAAPEDADEATPGRDASYTGEPHEMPPIEEEPVQGQWISIDLKTEEGEPVAGEPYEITAPSGLVLRGTLDVNGFAKRWVPEQGQCPVTFPRLNGQEWSRA